MREPAKEAMNCKDLVIWLLLELSKYQQAKDYRGMSVILQALDKALPLLTEEERRKVSRFADVLDVLD